MADETEPGRTTPKQRSQRRSTPAAGSAQNLPLEAEIISQNGGWSIYLPVRADHFALNKTTVVRERVVVRRGQVIETVHVSERVRKELPQVEQHGEALTEVAVEAEDGDAPPPAPPTSPRHSGRRRSG